MRRAEQAIRRTHRSVPRYRPMFRVECRLVAVGEVGSGSRTRLPCLPRAWSAWCSHSAPIGNRRRGFLIGDPRGSGESRKARVSCMAALLLWRQSNGSAAESVDEMAQPEQIDKTAKRATTGGQPISAAAPVVDVLREGERAENSGDID